MTYRLEVILALTLSLVTVSALGQPAPQRPANRPATPSGSPTTSDPAAREEWIKAHYTKYEHMIPMRDGVRLFTAVYIPKESKQMYPILLNRTPYSVRPYGEDRYPSFLGPSEKLFREGFIFANQDVRGRYSSEGEFVEMRPMLTGAHGPKDIDESTDTYDTIDWLVQHVPNNNGKVGTWGTSYPGFYVAAGMIDAHPALKAAAPGAPMTDLYMGADDAYHNGAFMLAQNFGFYTSFGKRNEIGPPEPRLPFDYKTPNAYDYYLSAGSLASLESKMKDKNPYWMDQVEHWTYDDYWKARSLVSHIRNIKPAVMTVGGWFDAEDLQGPFNVYNAIREHSPGTVNTLVEGPWSHGGWNRPTFDRLGSVAFNANTAEYFHDELEFPFFMHYLKGKEEGAQPPVVAFETGTNVWRRYNEWPPQAAKKKSLYLGNGGVLSPDAPSDPQGFDEYISDPNKPVPWSGAVSPNITSDYMVADQRFAATRPDVLVYQTEPLQEDLTIAGPIGVHLVVSTTGTDSDFVVKLIDVYPNDFPDPDPNPTQIHMGGYQQLLRGEPFRGKFRGGFEKPLPFTPGKTAEIAFDMPGLLHTFRRGHRLMIQVQSSWFPLVDRNPQTFGDIPHAKAADFVRATQRVYRSKTGSSSIVLNVLE